MKYLAYYIVVMVVLATLTFVWGMGVNGQTGGGSANSQYSSPPALTPKSGDSEMTVKVSWVWFIQTSLLFTRNEAVNCDVESYDTYVAFRYCDWKRDDSRADSAKHKGGELAAKQDLAYSEALYLTPRSWVHEILLEVLVHDPKDWHVTWYSYAKIQLPYDRSDCDLDNKLPIAWVTESLNMFEPAQKRRTWDGVPVSKPWKCNLK